MITEICSEPRFKVTWFLLGCYLRHGIYAIEVICSTGILLSNKLISNVHLNFQSKHTYIVETETSILEKIMIVYQHRFRMASENAVYQEERKPQIW